MIRRMFFGKFSKKDEPQKLVCEATDAALDQEYVLLSLNHLSQLSRSAGFSHEARF